LLLAWPAAAEPVRLATFHTELSRNGPGLLLRDILKGDPPVQAVAQVIAGAAPDVILLQGIDYDRGLQSAIALRGRILGQGLDLPHLSAFAPNTGVPTGFDLNGDGRTHGPEDAHGFGDFAGQGGMVLMSRYPLRLVRDFSGELWSDQADLEEIKAAWGDAADHLRLTSVGHWQVEVAAPGGPLNLVAFHATPPVFDGPEDRNGLRNAHQLAAITRHIAGLERSFVVLGNANNDPDKGEGRKRAIKALLGHPKIQDPLHGQPTVDWRKLGLGWMRVDYALPSAGLEVMAAGRYMWAPAAQASRHRLVWVDVELP
jgi:endonuclease/exonuclease/phosphatase family metal-dependent hydrolase